MHVFVCITFIGNSSKHEGRKKENDDNDDDDDVLMKRERDRDRDRDRERVLSIIVESRSILLKRDSATSVSNPTQPG